jgi:hypothetical protein
VCPTNATLPEQCGTAVANNGNTVVGDFGGDGVWKWAVSGGWTRLTGVDAEQIWVG